MVGSVAEQETFAPTAEDQALKKAMLTACEQDRALLMTAQPFTAMLAMQLDLVAVVDCRLPTAGTDGKTIFFNARFMAGRSVADRRFILAHEVWHCALGHHRRQLGRDHDRWNQACDYEVNHLLTDELGHCPRDALYNRDYRGLSAEEVYNRLQQENLHPHPGQSVLDEHDLAEVLTQSTDGLIVDPDFQPAAPKTPAESRALDEAWRQRLIVVAQQRERLGGTLPGHLSRIVQQIRQPSVPWQQLLARFLHKQHGGDRQWLPPSRRHIHRGLYLPSRRNNTLDITVALDNSGSCTAEVPRFLGELRGMLAGFSRINLQVLIFDTRICQRLNFCEADLHRLDNIEIAGGGGTDFRPVFEELEQAPPHALVILTDGFAEAPPQGPSYPVLWALTEGGECPVKWGEKLSMRR